MRIRAIVFDYHMGQSFPKMKEYIKEEKIDLKEKEMMLFINRKRTAFKVLTSDNVIAYYRNEKGVDLGIIQHLPKSFGVNGVLNFNSALRATLTKRLRKESGNGR